jgi:hypothetical protein
MTNKSAPEEFPLDEIDLLVGWRAGEDEYLCAGKIGGYSRELRSSLMSVDRMISAILRCGMPNSLTSAAHIREVSSYSVPLS